ncbi:rhodanese-like domain-containing protein 6 [Lolium rigidum]|uniref:rhodanese-like domain-containing protein 6 n=1 Tax=Lolium rigidum TaxID=89674 RepID=UPI001F5D10AB|nr:rhodanese-like domain-containing protein 6 [Lolium rigidum]
MMYCAGGIRCEMASAYIHSKSEGFENVFQLYGGIKRYLEQFPNGVYFDGKNFVLDNRIYVGSLKDNKLGTCLICGFTFTYDDYSSRCRCSHCRMLVLVFSTCQDCTKAEELKDQLGSGHPTFIKPMSHGYATKSDSLKILLNFRQHLPVHDEIMVLVDEMNNDFHLLYSYKNHRTDGCNRRINQWKGFAAKHELADGDCLVFQLIESRKFKHGWYTDL